MIKLTNTAWGSDGTDLFIDFNSIVAIATYKEGSDELDTRIHTVSGAVFACKETPGEIFRLVN